MDIVQNGHTLHLIVNADDLTAEDVGLIKAHIEAFKAVRSPDVTCAAIQSVYDAIATEEARWCHAHKFRHDRTLMMALARLTDNLHRHEARHASA